ncbi:MAG: DNA polymerase III subunit beta [Eubacteriales bacterium]|jgi:DNA polymerase-3 subunit beta
MKVVFDRKLLCSVFPPLLSAVSNKSTLSALEGVLIEAFDENYCILTTYDTDKGIRLRIDAKVFASGRYIVNAQRFFQVARAMDGNEIEVTIDNKLTAKIVSGRSSHKMPALDGDDFPSLPEIAHERGFVIGQALLKKMISQVSHAMGVDDTRPVLNGCYMKVEDKTITLVSCDSFSLAKRVAYTEIQNKNSDNSPLEFSFIVPVRTVNELVKLLSDDEEEYAEIYMTKKNIVFILGGITFFSRLIDGEYIDYNRIIIKNHKITAVLNREEFISALERAALVTEEKVAGSVRSPVKLEFSGNVLKIMASSSTGSTYDEVLIRHEGEDILIGFNNRFLMNNVRACSGERIKLSLSSPLTSMNIEPEENPEDGEELFMLLPIRMKE